jgi:hypothetical protein
MWQFCDRLSAHFFQLRPAAIPRSAEAIFEASMTDPEAEEEAIESGRGVRKFVRATP